MDRSLTIAVRMRASLGDLTPAERRAATHILSHFPMSALGSITALAEAAEVSSPTIMRLVRKLGYGGWSDYQAALKAEVERLLVAPLSLPEGALDKAPFVKAVQNFYFTNPIARASAVMAECSALAQSRQQQAAE